VGASASAGTRADSSTGGTGGSTAPAVIRRTAPGSPRSRPGARASTG
jgi:hypothetical protein